MFDYQACDLSVADIALCDYAVKLTRAPGKIAANDIAVLRAAELSDAQISIAAQVIGYFNYINRIADGLGVEHEDWMTLDPATWKAQKASYT